LRPASARAEISEAALTRLPRLWKCGFATGWDVYQARSPADGSLSCARLGVCGHRNAYLANVSYWAIPLKNSALQ
jgi:hypothetical protein